MEDLSYEQQAHDAGYALVCGVDEAGAGPLMGPVYAAAVILPKKFELPGLNDSKKLTEKKREALFLRIVEEAVCYCVASVSAAEIDAMRCAIKERQQKEEEAGKANRELVTAMSHDLRTPLTSLLGYVDILQMEKGEDRGQQRKYLNSIRDKGIAQALYEKWGDAVLDGQDDEVILELAVEEDVVNKFYEAIDKLSEQQRQVLFMSMEGAKVKDIAERLGISENSVKTQKKRAYAFVRNELGESLAMLIFILFS